MKKQNSNKQHKTPRNFSRTWNKVWNYKWVYLMLVPVMLYYIVFKYIPMYGITIAFKDYNVFEGVLKSPWCGFKVFEKIFPIKISGMQSEIP